MNLCLLVCLLSFSVTCLKPRHPRLRLALCLTHLGLIDPLGFLQRSHCLATQGLNPARIHRQRVGHHPTPKTLRVWQYVAIPWGGLHRSIGDITYFSSACWMDQTNSDGTQLIHVLGLWRWSESICLHYVIYIYRVSTKFRAITWMEILAVVPVLGSSEHLASHLPLSSLRDEAHFTCAEQSWGDDLFFCKKTQNT